MNEDQQKTKFTDLNDDCINLILVDLNFGDLLSVAQINVKFSALSADVYRRKYSDKQIWIVDYRDFPIELKKLFNETETIDINSFERIERIYPYFSNIRPYIDQIERNFLIWNFETMWNLFKHFGRDIKKLHATTGSKSPLKNAFIAYLINKYSSESLVDVQLYDNPDKLLDHLTKPMINVKSVEFSNSCGDTKIEIFRKVETLFPHVEKFSAKGFSLENGSIRMESVTTFIPGYSVSLASFHFPNLHTLHFDFEEHGNFAGYLTFLDEHRHLSHLHFIGNMPNESQFEELTANLKDLVEVTFEFQFPLSNDCIAKFLSSHEKVKLFKITRCDDQQLQQLLEPSGWNMTIINYGLSFERN